MGDCCNAFQQSSKRGPLPPRLLTPSRRRYPDGREAERRSDGKGGYFVTLPHAVVDRLKALRGPGESYSDRKS